MEDFTDFDILYQIKTPFFLGLNSKVLEEIQSIEIDSEDTLHTDLKHLYRIRAIAASNDMDTLKAEMQKLFKTHESFIRVIGTLI